jgi:phosphoribosylformylglycinamidine (FGAM) synthase-like amidotransferase family enzyme
MPKHDKEDKSNDLSVKKQYVSRRVRDYDDTDSAGEGDENDDDDDKAALTHQDTGVIQYVDTKGNTTTLKPNLRFLGFKNIF